MSESIRGWIAGVVLAAREVRPLEPGEWIKVHGERKTDDISVQIVPADSVVLTREEAAMAYEWLGELRQDAAESGNTPDHDLARALLAKLEGGAAHAPREEVEV